MSVRKFSSASISSVQPKGSKFWNQETFPGTYESIVTAIVDSGGASSITFSNIPQTYAHLQIRGIGKTDGAGNGYSMLISVNSDTTTTNYRTHYLYGEGSTAISGTYNTFSGVLFPGDVTGAGSNVALFGANIIDILDYSSTTKNKTFRSLGGQERNGAGNIGLNSGLWINTSAITSLSLTVAGDTNFVQYSHFSLYGIRGA